MGGVIGAGLAAAGGPSHPLPVGRPVAGALVPGALDEGLQQHRGEAVALLPVGGQTARRHAQHLGGQAGTVHPRQDQEARVVDHPVQPAAPLRIGPADVALPVGQPPGGGGEADQRHALFARVDAVAQLPGPTSACSPGSGSGPWSRSTAWSQRHAPARCACSAAPARARPL